MGNKRKDSNFWESAYMNNRTYIQYYNRLMELAVSMFEWKNLPEPEGEKLGVDSRFLELTLFADGKAVFFEDEVMGCLALQCMINGQLNVYRIPKQRRAFSVNGYQRELDETNSVIIYNNYLRTNSMLDVEMFAKRLYNMDRIIDVNVNAQKTPILLACDETERLTILNLYKQYDGNEPFIAGRKNLSNQPIQALNTGATYVADKIYTLKSQIWNEALTYLGISNTNITKKERLITDEVQRNMGGVIASRYSRLEMRRKACNEINRMFGLNISVDYREDFTELVERTTNEVLVDKPEEGENNE